MLEIERSRQSLLCRDPEYDGQADMQIENHIAGVVFIGWYTCSARLENKFISCMRRIHKTGEA